ncbi:MAG TPA: D-TA family PLP-dependent enzyme [Roseiflexaceae bacterium]
MHIDQLDTPVAIVDLDRLAANIARFQAYLDQHGIANRPHIKTHKITEIAHMQLAAGAAGITCQKLGEAEVMVQAGVRDILLTYNILGEAKLERLVRLARRASISVTADSETTVRGLAEAATRGGITLPLLVEFDGGKARCGVQSPREAADLARTIARSGSLRFGGLMTFPTDERTDAFVRATRELLAAGGIAVERVSGGGTPQMWQAHEHPEVDEHRAGVYIFGDRHTISSGAVKLEDCAFKVLATVVSRPTADCGILDGGSKTFSSDLLGLDGYGMILEYPEARFYGISEEHGHVDFSACARRPAIGERVSVIANHCCPVVNLFNQLVGVRGDQVEVVWPVAARGALQ